MRDYGKENKEKNKEANHAAGNFGSLDSIVGKQSGLGRGWKCFVSSKSTVSRKPILVTLSTWLCLWANICVALLNIVLTGTGNPVNHVLLYVLTDVWRLALWLVPNLEEHLPEFVVPLDVASSANGYVITAGNA